MDRGSCVTVWNTLFSSHPETDHRPHRSAGWVIALLMAAVLASTSRGEVLNVPSSEYPTIQSAIDAAAEGDEIVVQPGTYTESVQFHGVDITLRSADPMDPQTVEATVIDPIAVGPAVEFEGSETEACLLTGLTLTDSSGNVGSYGILGHWSRATIERCPVTAFENGGIHRLDGTIRLCTITRNGWCALGDCGGLIQSNVITHNGRALWMCDGVIEDNVISECWHGEQAALTSCQATVRRNIIVNNHWGGWSSAMD
jgi:Right handed beta helix region